MVFDYIREVFERYCIIIRHATYEWSRGLDHTMHLFVGRHVWNLPWQHKPQFIQWKTVPLILLYPETSRNFSHLPNIAKAISLLWNVFLWESFTSNFPIHGREYVMLNGLWSSLNMVYLSLSMKYGIPSLVYSNYKQTKRL